MKYRPLILMLLAGFSIMGAGYFFGLINKKSETPVWQLVNDFEQENSLQNLTRIDAQNETDPFVANPQISELREIAGNKYLLKKPAADGVVGNRKAITISALPQPIAVGETYTLYARVNVEYFPNNHSFGLANVALEEIGAQNYNAFEPMIRITDKFESDGSKNDGTLMVLVGHKIYSKITNPNTAEYAKPMVPDTWYEIWCVVNNAPSEAGGQTYDLYVRGGEFSERQLVFEGASFRMKRGAPLGYFMTISNTGPVDKPYGNGGVRYDDIYIAAGHQLTSPLD